MHSIIILVLILFLFLAIDFCRYKTLFSPAFVFNVIFIVTLLLYEEQMSYIQTDLNARTIFILWSVVLSFNFGYLLFTSLKASKTIRIIHYIDSNQITYSEKRKYHYLCKNTYNIMKILVFSIFVIEVIYSRGFPLLWKITGDSRNYFDFGIPSFNGAFYGLLIFIGAYSFSLKNKDKYLFLLIPILMISRQALVAIILEGFVFLFLTTKVRIKRPILKLILAFLLIIALFSIIGNIRTGKDDFEAVAQFKEEYSGTPVVIKWVYSYMTFSLSNFNNLVSMTNGGVNYGASTFNDVLPTVLQDFFQIKENVIVNYRISINFNVSTFMPELYLDFGIMGIVLFVILISFVSAKIFTNYRKSKDSMYAILLAVVIHNILMLFFVNMFLYLPIAIQFVYIPLLYKRKYIVFKNREYTSLNAIGRCKLRTSNVSL